MAKEGLSQEQRKYALAGGTNAPERISQVSNESFFIGAYSWDELYRRLVTYEAHQGMLEGSKMLYSAEDLKEIIDLVRQGRLPLTYVTRTGGLRAVVGELLAKERATRMAETIVNTDAKGRPAKDKSAEPFAWVHGDPLDGFSWVTAGEVGNPDQVIDSLVSERLANIEKELNTLKGQLNKKQEQLRVLEEKLRSEGIKFHENNHWLELSAQITILELQVFGLEKELNAAGEGAPTGESYLYEESAFEFTRVETLIDLAKRVENLDSKKLRSIVHELTWNLILLSEALAQIQMELTQFQQKGNGKLVERLQQDVQKLKDVIEQVNTAVWKVHNEIARRDQLALGGIEQSASSAKKGDGERTASRFRRVLLEKVGELFSL